MTPFLTLVIAGLLSRFSYQMARSPVLPRFAQDLGATPELIGLIVGASTITGVFIKLPAGALSDLLGRKRMLLLGALFFAGPPFLYPLVGGPIALLLLRFLHGLATAIFSPVAAAYVADLFQQGRGEKLGWFASANDVGATAGPLLGGLILFYTASYPTTYLVVGLLGLLPLLLVLRLPEGIPHSPAAGRPGRWEQFRRGVAEVLSNPAVVIASIMEATMYLGYAAFQGFFPPYARGIGLNDAQIGVVMGVQLATTMAAKPLTGRLSDQIGRKPLIFAGLVLVAVMLPLIPATRALGPLLVWSALLGLGVATVTPSTTALIADLARRGRMGSAMGVFGTIWDTGEASGPIVAGFLIGTLSYPPAFLILSGILALSALIFAVAVPDPQAGTAPTHP
ncbi:MAG: MFS transporter [Deltaproteobacteria bacterium]|nr:MFS transporter [Deltaproteobacteria bacterium]MBI3077474.1 MFS transporter [Deltaproteobacteria bacterium]